MHERSEADGERDFCIWLRQLRTEQDLTQEALAEAVSCSTQTVRSFESGRRRPSRELAARLASVLQVPADERVAFIRLARAPLVSPESGQDQRGADMLSSQSIQSRISLPVDSLIGRQVDLQRLRQALVIDRRRLVTLLGPGGIGKTRVALQSAADLASHFDDGVAVVALAALVNPADVATAIAEAIGCQLPGTHPPERALLTCLHERALLLVLDNLEHLLGPEHNDRTRLLLGEILREAPEVTILCTSRERLRLRAEWVIEIDGLGVPDDDRTGAIERADAALLFLERARQVLDTFTLTAENRAAVARICRLLGGVPLGIELAAAWVRVMSCSEIADEMASNIDFLTLDDPDIPQRHRSIRAVIEQSWQMLTADEQGALLRLSVFRGGFRRESAEAVCAELIGRLGGAQPQATALLPVLSGLVDKSRLRRAADYDGATRYDLHEVLRQYLVARLATDPVAARAVQHQHATYFAAWLKMQDAALKSARQSDALRAITAEIGNIRLAWRWAVEMQDAAMLRQMAETLHWFFEVRGWNIEGSATFGAGAAALGALAAQSGAGADGTQATYWLLVTLDGWHAVRSDPAAALPRLHAGLHGQRQTHDPGALALCLVTVAYVQIFVGDYPSAQALLEEAEGICEERGYAWVLSVARVVRGVLETLRSEPEIARQYLRRALLTARAAGDPRHIALTLNYLGLAALSLGQVDEAERVCQECLGIAQAHQDRFQMSLALQSLGRVAVARGAYMEGENLLHTSIALACEMGDRWLESQTLGCLAQLALATGDSAGARSQQRSAVEVAAAAPQPIALDELAGLAELELATQPDAAMSALAYVRQHPLSRPAARERAERHWRDIWRRLPAERCLAAEAAARTFPQDQPAALAALFHRTVGVDGAA